MKNLKIQEWFSQTAATFSQQIAIASLTQTVTYGELEQRTNNLANFLQSQQTPKAARIAILSEDSLEVIIAVIAALKAGCAFVPLSTNIPRKRLETLIQDISPHWLIIDAKQGEKLANLGLDCTKLIVLGDWENPPQLDLTLSKDYEQYWNIGKPKDRSEPDDLCYLYLTSGSTGKPKMIAGRLKAIAQFIHWEINLLKLPKNVRVSQLISPAFDAFLRDIFVPLCSGGTICIPDSWETIVDARKLVDWLERQKINLIHCVPSLLRSLLAQDLKPTQFSALNYILLSGEVLLGADIRRWRSVYGDRVQLINLYGPSETTMTKFFYLVKSSDETRKTIPIGKPMEGAAALVVDANGKVCPPGIVGEIYIRTPYRTLGYYQQPQLTQEVFIANPFSNKSNDIVYKTGDLARILEDGNFDYVGRKDRQVKIRGVRVELGEIENALQLHPAVKEGVVVAWDDRYGNKYLCAYVVLNKTLDSAQLREFLLARLPESLVPSAFAIVEALPRTISGKIDRRSLCEPTPAQRTRAFTPPKTPLEAQLAQLWQEVLKVAQVGVEDNFFALGGHSLLATQLVSRIERSFQIQLPLRVLFESPSLGVLAQTIQTLQATQTPSKQPFPRIYRPRNLPLSFAQQRLWFLDRLLPDSSAYNMPMAVQIRGHLNITALEKSLNEIIQRHEICRTKFQTVAGSPTQIIVPHLSLTLEPLDLTTLRNEQQQAQVQQLTAAANEPFDLATAPLLRASLVQLSDRHYILLLTIHHIIFDAWSMGILIQELTALYSAFSQGNPSPLAPLKMQYADFACWQRQQLSEANLDKALAYWKQKLEGDLPPLTLPADRPRPPIPTFKGARQPFQIDNTLTAQLRQLSQQQGATLFMILLTAWKILIYRYTSQEDLRVGTAIAGRPGPEVESLIGCFVNTLVLRSHLSGDCTVLAALEQVREVALEAYAHQELPFEKLVEELQPERVLSHSPLFQVGFAFYGDRRPDLTLEGLSLNPINVDSGTAKLDLTLSLREEETGLTGWVEYATDLFDVSTIERMLGHYQTLLVGMVRNPEQRLDRLPLLATQERQQLLQQWNQTQTPYPQTLCLHQQFQHQVAQTPASIALLSEGVQLTYGELNQKANQLAHYLQDFGVKPEVRVGLYLSRSPEAIIALFAILKAGGAYVPLDPSYPQERLALILDDAQISVLISQGTHFPLDSILTTPQHIDLERDRDRIARASQDNPESSVTIDNLAYIIYTSGSTGKPKGVLVEHRGLVNLALAQIQAFGIEPSSRVLQFASLNFDASVSEIAMTLLAGATLCLSVSPLPLVGKALTNQLRDWAISTVTLPPSVLATLPVVDLPALQTLILAGETPAARAIASWASGRRLFNAYGPTEATVCATLAECNPRGDRVPIGRPIANVQVYLLDCALQPVPIGIPGELYIGGVGVARGYQNRPDLTQERFIPNPFDPTSQGRLYRTGDLARYQPDGSLEFLGRLDTQVKIRGFRVELEEIEATLNQHPDVLSAVALCQKSQPDSRLVVYAVPKAGQTLECQTLKDFLKQRLPNYMIPAAAIVLDTLPLTANGKIDRQALPMPELGLPKKIPARDSLERELIAIWEKVLNLASIGVTDNFFDLGGHSLLAVQLMALIEQHFGVELPLSLLFEAGTVEHLATKVRSTSGSQTWSPLVNLQTQGSKPPLFCVHPIGGSVFGYEELARQLAPERPFYGLQAPGLAEHQQPYTSIPDLATYYLKAIRSVQPCSPYYLAGHSFGGLVAFEMAQQLFAQGEVVALLAILDTPAPIGRKVPEPIDDALWLVRRAQVLERFFGKTLSLTYADLQQKTPEAQIKDFCNKLREAELLPPDAGEPMIRRILQVQKASHQALLDYVPQIYPGKITLLQAAEVVASDTRGIYAESFNQPALGWNCLTREVVSVHSVPGNHITMLTRPYVQDLADILQSCLAL
ncbi:MAG: amino acid adenylation domain-containing protein [Kamptonema sp. SIO1D9]|nr:amino acid adenylation domain-containing protein [Kamptonema sp. SIO1D9]